MTKPVMCFEELEFLVIAWAKERGIFDNPKAYTQLLKAVSEMGELADAEIKNDEAAIQDAVGDVLVCLINYCATRKIGIVDCLESAYNEIKDRKGKMSPSGAFIKESDNA
jgi:NTP pyrophosphatase (non-canonical NTP hydrolase)